MCEKRCLLGYIVCFFLLSRWEIWVNVSSERPTVQMLSHFILLDSAGKFLYAQDPFPFRENFQKCLEGCRSMTAIRSQGDLLLHQAGWVLSVPALLLSSTSPGLPAQP